MIYICSNQLSIPRLHALLLPNLRSFLCLRPGIAISLQCETAPLLPSWMSPMQSTIHEQSGIAAGKLMPSHYMLLSLHPANYPSKHRQDSPQHRRRNNIYKPYHCAPCNRSFGDQSAINQVSLNIFWPHDNCCWGQSVALSVFCS